MSRQHTLLASLLAVALSAGAAGAAHAQTPKEKAARYYEDAQARFERKDIAGTIIQLKNALQADKTLLPVQLLLGRALLMDGQAAAAEVAITEALRLGVDRAEVALILGQALLAQGKHQQVLDNPVLAPAGLPADTRLNLLLLRSKAYGERGESANALQAIEEARSIDRNAPDTWLAEVPVRLRAGQFKEATTAADTALKLAPSSAEAVYQRGTIAHLRSDVPGAIKLYSKALELDPGHIESRIARAGLYIDTRQDADAAADIEEARKRSPREPRAAYMKAVLLERAGDRVKAKVALGEVVGLLDAVPIEFIRYRPQMLLLAGLAHFGLEEYGKAKPFLDLFCRAQPGTPASKVLARIYAQENNADRAIDLLESYRRTYPNDGQALIQLSAAYMAKGRANKATELLEAALKTRDAPEYHTALGIALSQSGDSSAAQAQLEAAIKKDPRQIQAGMALVPLLLRDNQAAKAAQLADQLLRQAPGDATLLNLAGVAKAQAGDFGGARRNFESAAMIDNKQLAPQLGLARLDIATRAYESAIRRLKAILKTDERNAEATYDMAVVLQRTGKLDEAQRYLERAAELSGKTDLRADYALVDLHLKTNRPAVALERAKVLLGKAPEDVTALRTYARVQLVNGDNPGARQTLIGASRRAGFDPELQTSVAALQVAAGDDASAAYSLDKALSNNPDFIPAIALLCGVELRRNDLAKAEARARRIIQLQPKLPIGHQLLGDVALARGQTRPAIEAYRQAFKIQASSATALQLVRMLSAQGEAAEATSTATQWLKSNPGDAAVRKALGDHLARNRDFARARSEYEAAIKLAPNDAQALNNLANVLIKLKDYKAAISTAELALSKSNNEPIIVDTLGWALFQDGQIDAALLRLRDARLRSPSNPEVRYHLAATLAKAGKRTEARDELQAALRENLPFEGQAEAKALLDTLK
ncbi:MAG: PEP-CTERM system TPR-repeat protein PrsT [Methylotenera sp.]|jgi:cellulose synthase operon protein C|nr:PEP-CTERM system TPR-repeat protein PrsT [Methylotenera sp.]